MANRKQVDDLQGRSLTPEQREIRRKQEARSFEWGYPARPQGLPRPVREAWNLYAAKLHERRLLAYADVDALLAVAEAKVEGGDVNALLEATWGSREPFPESPTPQTSAAPSHVTAPVAVRAADTAKAYAVDITTGQIIAGKYVKLACERFLSDLAGSPGNGLTFDAAAVQRAIDYIARLDLGALMPWQTFVLANLYGWRRADGLRRFRNAHLEVAKKNGKSSMLAAIGLYMADPYGDGEDRAEVYVAATTRFQSRDICFREARRLRDKSADLSERSKAFRAAMQFGDSIFEPLAANSEKLNGRNIHCGILDELADHPTPDLFNVFSTSTVGRKQSLLISITTAGQAREGNVAWHQRQHAAQVLEGAIQDESFFAFIAALDESDPWDDPAVWIKANPSLGVTVQIENLRDAAERAKTVPSTKNAFLRYHLDLWQAVSDDAWLSIEDLNRPGNLYRSDEEHLSAAERIRNAEKRLEKRFCMPGLDLATVGDLSALALIFPPANDDEPYEVLFKVWCPEADIARRSREQRVPYELWANEKFITPTPGEITDFNFIKQEIISLRDRYRIKELAFDPHMAPDTVNWLRSQGLPVTAVAQGYGLSAAIHKLEWLVRKEKFLYHGNPVARWCFSNVVLDKGVKDVRLAKNKSREKIDLVSAAATAMDLVLKTPIPRRSAGIRFIELGDVFEFNKPNPNA